MLLVELIMAAAVVLELLYLGQPTVEVVVEDRQQILQPSQAMVDQAAEEMVVLEQRLMEALALLIQVAVVVAVIVIMEAVNQVTAALAAQVLSLFATYAQQ
jgi:hypothetical protein